MREFLFKFGIECSLWERSWWSTGYFGKQSATEGFFGELGSEQQYWGASVKAPIKIKTWILPEWNTIKIDTIGSWIKLILASPEGTRWAGTNYKGQNYCRRNKGIWELWTGIKIDIVIIRTKLSMLDHKWLQEGRLRWISYGTKVIFVRNARIESQSRLKECVNCSSSKAKWGKRIRLRHHYDSL